MGISQQPAQKTYLFEKGYLDVFLTITGAWKKNRESIREYRNHFLEEREFGVDGVIHKCKLCIISIAVFSIIFFGSIVTFLLSIMNVMAYLIVVCGYCVYAVILWIADRVCLIWSSNYHVCKNCKAKNTIPTYACPNCGVKHTNLTPGIYGAWKRKCRCGTKIPVTSLNGKQNLVTLCSHCGATLKRK